MKNVLRNFLLTFGAAVRVGCFKNYSSVKDPFVNKEYNEFIRNVFKKFMFQVHPDYFFHDKKLQEINNINLTLLTNLIDRTDSVNSRLLNSLPRSLTFYVKVSDLVNDDQPKKVRVSTIRTVDSLIDILETIGVEIPEKPIDFDAFYNSLVEKRGEASPFVSNRTDEKDPVVDSETLRTLNFLDSLGDRRELILLREERNKIFHDTEEVILVTRVFFAYYPFQELLRMTGLDKIEYWNSWSLQNNRLLLTSIIHFVEDNRDLLQLPWNGLSLLFGKDDSPRKDIDYVERTIYIDCSEPSMQWKNSLLKITQQNLRIMREIAEKVLKIKSFFRNYIYHLLKSEMMKQNQPVPDGKPLITIDIEKGFTCSETQFSHFLARIQKDFGHYDTLPESLSSHENGSSKNNSSSNSLDSSLFHVKIVIEDRYGTKLLPTGTFRIDWQASRDKIEEILHRDALHGLQLIQENNFMMKELENLEKDLVHLLDLRSLEKGKGINDDQYLACLKNIHSYLMKRDKQKKAWSKDYNEHPLSSSMIRGIFQHLYGLKVSIGYFSGIRDDGVILLPWNFRIP
jgi:hypothetical protein